MSLLGLLVLPLTFLISQQNLMTESGVVIEAYLGVPVYFDNIQNTKFLILFEGGEGEVFLFFTSDLIGATIGCGLPP